MARAGAPVLALGLAALAVVAMAVFLTLQSRAAARLEERAVVAAAQAQDVVTNGLILLHAVTYAETGQRGYLLTGRKENLEPYSASVRRAQDMIAALDRIAQADPAYRRQLPAIRRALADRLDAINETIRLAADGRRQEALTRLPEGRLLQAQLRSEIEVLISIADAKHAAVRAERRRFDQQAQAMQSALAAASVAALLLAIAALAMERINAARAAVVRERMNAELEAARARAEEADKAKSRFLAAASHDLRQPLHALSLYITALDRRVESDQAREILGNMDGAVRSMTRMFTALLDLARLEAGILRPEPIDFEIQELLEEVAAHSVDPRAGRATIRIVPTRLKVSTDPDLLEIALRNLTSNAVKHSKGGRVLLGCRRDDDQVRIEVHDDGQGIPEDQLSRLFGEFVRGEQARSTEGVGLGLAIVERMAKLLGHPLSVRSRVGRGTVFCITVPRASGEAAANQEPADVADLKGMRVLLADDEPLALDAMRRALEDAGATVTPCDSAAAARARAAQDFDLHVFDLNLDRENGLDLLAEFDAALRRRVPALVVTGATTPELLEHLRSSGRTWLTKPVSAAALTRAAARVLTEG